MRRGFLLGGGEEGAVGFAIAEEVHVFDEFVVLALHSLDPFLKEAVDAALFHEFSDHEEHALGRVGCSGSGVIHENALQYFNAVSELLVFELAVEQLVLVVDLFLRLLIERVPQFRVLADQVLHHVHALDESLTDMVRVQLHQPFLLRPSSFKLAWALCVEFRHPRKLHILRRFLVVPIRSISAPEIKPLR